MSLPRIHRFADSPPSAGSALLGGKGWLLNQLSNAGYQVPPGFTLTTAAFPELIGPGPLQEPLGNAIRNEVRNLEQQVARRFGDTCQPLFLAVRSGAVNSMPGLLRTVLGVGVTTQMLDHSPSPECQNASRLLRTTLPEWFSSTVPHSQAGTSPDDLTDAWQQLMLAIQLVAESWNDKAAAEFRRQQGITDHLGTAVNVQVLAPTELAGVLYTRHPSASRRHMMLVEFAPLGIDVVSGRQTPGCQELPRTRSGQGGDIDRAGTGHSKGDSRISEALAAELTEIGHRLEQEPWLESHPHPMPRDRDGLEMEWGWAQGTVQIFQVRRVPPARGIGYLRDVGAPGEHDLPTPLVKHSISDSLVNPTPLTWSLLRTMLAGDGALGDVYRRLGYRPGRATYGKGLWRKIRGHIYADVEATAQLFGCGIPLRYDLEQLWPRPEIMDTAPTQLDPDACGPWFLLSLPISLCRLLRSAWLARPRVATMQRQQARVTAEYFTWQAVQMARLTVSTGVANRQAHFRDASDYVLKRLPVHTMTWSLHAAIATSRLQRRLEAITRDPLAASRFTGVLLDHLAAWPVSPALASRCRDMYGWDQADFGEAYGHRGDNEWELAGRPLRQSTGEVKKSTSSAPGDGPDAVHLRVELGRVTKDQWGRAWLPARWNRSEAECQLQHELGLRAGSGKSRSVLRLAQTAAALAPGREVGRDLWLRGYDVLRRIVERLALDLDLDHGSPPDVYFLEAGEVAGTSAADASLRDQVATRRKAWHEEFVPDMPRILGGPAELQRPRLPTQDAHLDYYAGFPLAQGFSSGHVVHASVDSTPADHKLNDVIIVCETLDAGLIPYLTAVRGIITENGGMLSHLAVVARQLGIPVVRLTQARSLLPRGTPVRLDGATGGVSCGHVEPSSD